MSILSVAAPRAWRLAMAVAAILLPAGALRAAGPAMPATLDAVQDRLAALERRPGMRFQ